MNKTRNKLVGLAAFAAFFVAAPAAFAGTASGSLDGGEDATIYIDSDTHTEYLQGVVISIKKPTANDCWVDWSVDFSSNFPVVGGELMQGESSMEWAFWICDTKDDDHYKVAALSDTYIKITHDGVMADPDLEYSIAWHFQSSSQIPTQLNGYRFTMSDIATTGEGTISTNSSKTTDIGGQGFNARLRVYDVYGWHENIFGADYWCPWRFETSTNFPTHPDCDFLGAARVAYAWLDQHVDDDNGYNIPAYGSCKFKLYNDSTVYTMDYFDAWERPGGYRSDGGYGC